jgi:glutaminyl-tRNA synthetase
VFNRIIGLKDSWTKEQETRDKGQGEREAKRVASPIGEARDPVLSFSTKQKTKLEQLKKLGIAHDDAVLLTENLKLANYLEAALKVHNQPQGLANWIVNDIRREMEGDDPTSLPFAAPDLAALVALIDKGVISKRIAKDVFAEMVKTGTNPAVIVKAKGLEQVKDSGALEPIVDKVIAANPDKVTAYQNGKTGLIGFFVGQVMRETGGKANPQLVQELVSRKLSG